MGCHRTPDLRVRCLQLDRKAQSGRRAQQHDVDVGYGPSGPAVPAMRRSRCVTARPSALPAWAAAACPIRPASVPTATPRCSSTTAIIGSHVLPMSSQAEQGHRQPVQAAGRVEGRRSQVGAEVRTAVHPRHPGTQRVRRLPEQRLAGLCRLRAGFAQHGRRCTAAAGAGSPIPSAPAGFINGFANNGKLPANDPGIQSLSGTQLPAGPRQSADDEHSGCQHELLQSAVHRHVHDESRMSARPRRSRRRTSRRTSTWQPRYSVAEHAAGCQRRRCAMSTPS